MARYVTVTPVTRPAVPGLTAIGLDHVRQDCLGRAAAAEKQADDALAARNIALAQRCGGEAHALRAVAAQLVSYALVDTWGVQPDPWPLPTAIPAPAEVPA